MNNLVSVTVKFTSDWWKLISKVPTSNIIVPFIPELPDEYKLILKIEIDGVIQSQFVATHRIDTYSNVFNLFNNLYSVFVDDNYTNFIATQRLQTLNATILSSVGITEIVNSYPLSNFAVEAKIDCDGNS